MFDTTRQHEKTLTQELQLVSPDSSAIKWATGLYFFRGKALLRDGDVTVYGLPTVIARTNGSQTTHSYSVFGQATVPVMTDNTHVTLGGRYTTEKRRYSGYQQISIGMSPFFFTDIAGVPVASIDRLRNNSVDFCYDIGVIDPPERLSFLDMIAPKSDSSRMGIASSPRGASRRSRSSPDPIEPKGEERRCLRLIP